MVLKAISTISVSNTISVSFESWNIIYLQMIYFSTVGSVMRPVKDILITFVNSSLMTNRNGWSQTKWIGSWNIGRPLKVSVAPVARCRSHPPLQMFYDTCWRLCMKMFPTWTNNSSRVIAVWSFSKVKSLASQVVATTCKKSCEKQSTVCTKLSLSRFM